MKEKVGFKPWKCEIPQKMSLTQNYHLFLLLLLWKDENINLQVGKQILCFIV